jgi:histidyl-tRNA synthetase
MLPTKANPQHEILKPLTCACSLMASYLEAFGTVGSVHIDLSLARGLDYYTGVIYEAVLVDGETKVGSIAAGGRYDNMVGQFAGKDIPAVGVSIGIERVMAIMEAKARESTTTAARRNKTDVLVTSIGPNLLPHRIRLCSALWAVNIKAEFPYAENPKFQKQLTQALECGVPLLVIIGEDELAKGEVLCVAQSSQSKQALFRLSFLTSLQVKLRDLDATNADGSKGREWTVRFDDVVAEVQQVRRIRVSCL